MDINVALMYGVGLAALNLNGPALRGAVFFSLACLIHSDLSAGMSDILYYASAAVADFVVLFVLYGLRPVDETVDGLAWVCVISFVSNVAGLVMWFMYYTPDTYNIVMTLVYAAALFVVVKGGSSGGLGNRSFYWRASLPGRTSRPGHTYGVGHTEATKS